MRLLLDEILPIFSQIMSDWGIRKDEWRYQIGRSTVKDHGDISFPCHTLSRHLKKSPEQISIELVERFGNKLTQVAEISNLSGFVNFKATKNWISEKISLLSNDDRLGIVKNKSRRIVVDYSAPNVAKEMHVGHLRSTVIGDAIVRMLDYMGHKVIRENHIGDWGTPFGMLIEHLLDLGEERAVSELNVGDLDAFYKQARSKFNSDSDFTERSRKRVVLLQSGDPDTIRLWTLLVDESMKYFNEIYEILGVLLTDEDIMGESRYQELLPTVVQRLSENGLLENSDGADVIFPGGWTNREGEPLPMIIRKNDGGYNYSTTDLACIIDRVERLDCQTLLYVVGTPQKQHFEMIFQVASQANFIDEKNTTTHVNFGSVLGKDGKILKSREGNAVKLLDLLNEAISRATNVIIEKNPEITGDEREKVAKIVGIGAVKYADLSTDRTKDYVFDWEKMLSFEGNTAPYLQYAYARICSIFEKWGGDISSINNHKIVCKTSEEENLCKRLLEFAEKFEESINSYSPHTLCTHIFSIASAFATFYENCKIINVNDELTTLSRIAICEVTAREIELGLKLLGIQSPSRM